MKSILLLLIISTFLTQIRMIIQKMLNLWIQSLKHSTM